MKKIILCIAAATMLAACSQEPKKSTSTDATTVQTSMGEFDSYGQLISPDSAIAAVELAEEMGNAPTYETKIKGKLVEVCQKKGCWMTVDIGNGELMRVSFKDYSFFVPTDQEKMVGKEVIFQGTAMFESISVEDQKHYAEDAGESKEKIAEITEPKNSLSFEAIGVLVPKDAEAKAAASM